MSSIVIENAYEMNDDNYTSNGAKKYTMVSNNRIGEEEKKAMIDVINGGRITYGPVVKEFQEEFSQYIHSNYSVMVNSGSSAILLALSAALNMAWISNCTS